MHELCWNMVFRFGGVHFQIECHLLIICMVSIGNGNSPRLWLDAYSCPMHGFIWPQAVQLAMWLGGHDEDLYLGNHALHFVSKLSFGYSMMHTVNEWAVHCILMEYSILHSSYFSPVSLLVNCCDYRSCSSQGVPVANKYQMLIRCHDN